MVRVVPNGISVGGGYLADWGTLTSVDMVVVIADHYISSL